MQIRKGLCGLLVALGILLPTGAYADQPRDWFVSGARDEGSYLTLDVLLGAVQATLENDTKIYGNANQLTLRAGALAALPFAQGGVGFDLRMLILSLGMDVGGQSVWRGMSCPPGVECNRKQLRELDAAGDYQPETFPYWEGRAQLVFPFNDYSLFVAQTSYRVSSAPDYFYDYQNSIMRDGDLLNTNVMLFAKHRDWGALAPMIQHQNYAVFGQRVNQMNFGFTYISRAGLVQRDDAIILRMLFHDHTLLGGDRVVDTYGNYRWRGPFTLLFVYRSVISL